MKKKTDEEGYIVEFSLRRNNSGEIVLFTEERKSAVSVPVLKVMPDKGISLVPLYGLSSWAEKVGIPIDPETSKIKIIQ